METSKKYLLKYVVSGSERQKRHVLLQLLQNVKQHDRWKLLVKENDEVKNISLMDHFRNFVLPEFLQIENDISDVNKIVPIVSHSRYSMVKWEQYFWDNLEIEVRK